MPLRRIVLGLAAVSLSASPLFAAPAAHAAPKGACIRAEIPPPGRLLAQSAPGMIALGRAARMVKLEPVCGDAGSAQALAERVAAASPHQRFLLVIEDLRARVQPGVLFDLRLGPTRSGGDGAARLGTLNFFAAEKPGAAPRRPRMISYDVTATLKALAASDALRHGLTLAIRPADDPAPDAGAAIGRVALVEQ